MCEHLFGDAFCVPPCRTKLSILLFSGETRRFCSLNTYLKAKRELSYAMRWLCDAFFTTARQVCLSEALSTRITRNPKEAAVASMADEILWQTQLKDPEEGLALAPSGWHPVRASFEVDKVRYS